VGQARLSISLASSLRAKNCPSRFLFPGLDRIRHARPADLPPPRDCKGHLGQGANPAQGMNDGARVQRSYTAFRAKWDNRRPRNAQKAALLRDAKKYYYSVHKPFRDFKVARAALSDFFTRPSVATLRWFMSLIASALRGFLFRRSEPSHLRKCI